MQGWESVCWLVIRITLPENREICGIYHIPFHVIWSKSAGPLGPPGCEGLPWAIVLPSWWFKPQDWSSYRLDDLSLKTDGWYLYECCFPAPRNRTVTTPDVRCLNSGVPPGNPALWNRTVTTSDVRCLNSGAQPENLSIFKPASRPAKTMKMKPKATQNHEKSTLELQETQFLPKLIFLQYIPCQMLVFAIPDTKI